MKHLSKPRLAWNPSTQSWLVHHDASGHKLQNWFQKQFQPLVDALNHLNSTRITPPRVSSQA